jgi:Domain of unknown function (DUF4314)
MTTDQLKGRRVRLIRCIDEHTRLAPGAEGTVTLVDDLGTVHVTWDDGHRLGLIAEAGDRWEVLDDDRCAGYGPAPKEVT